MAQKLYWWPRTIPQQKVWMLNFPGKVLFYKLVVPITDLEYAQVVKDCNMFIYLIDYDADVRLFMAEFMIYRLRIFGGETQESIGLPPVCPIISVPVEVLTGMLNRIFNLVTAIKSRGGYNTVIGTAMKIIGADIPPFIPEEYVANGKGKGTVDGIEINFVKGIFISGMAVFEQRGADPEFHEIIRIYKKGYKVTSYNLVDNKPETRNFKTRAFVGNDLIGEYSPVFSVTWTSPPRPTPPPVEPPVV